MKKIFLQTIAAVAALTVFVSMKKSGHFLKSFFVSTAQGIASLFAVNALCGLTGVSLSVNALTLGSAAVFGTPGVIMNLIAQIIMTK